MLHLRFRQGKWVLAALLTLQFTVCPAFGDGPETESPSRSVPGDADATGKVQQAEATSPTGKQDTILTDFRAAGTKLTGRKTKSEKQDANETDGLTTVEKGSSSSAARKAALAALPLDQLTPEKKAQADAVLQSVSYFRRMPTVAVAVDPQAYTFFVNHPDVAVSIWRAMNISKLELWQTGRNEYEGDAGDGTVGTIEVLHRGVDKTLVLSEGVYNSPLSNKPIKAKSLLALQSSFFKESDGTVYVTHRADLFVTFPSQTVEAVSKILSPVTGSLTDRTFCEISMFLKMMSLAMVRRPDWVEHIADKLDGIPEMRKNQLLLLTTNMYTAAQKQALASDPDQKPGKPPVTAAREGAAEKK